VPIDDQQRSLVTSFTALVRQAQLPGVDAQRLGMAFRMALEQMQPGKPVDVRPLFDWLVRDQKIAESAVVDFFVILKSREDRLGATFMVPQKVMWLPPQEIERALNAFQARIDRARATAEPARPAAPAFPAPAPGPAPAARRLGERPTWLPYALALGLVALAGVGFFVWRAVAHTPIVAIAPPAGGGLACTRLVTDKRAAMCDLPQSVWDAGPEETLRAQATLTHGALAASGVQRLFVRIAETGRVVIVLP
jgi:hypothetical protein